MKFHGILLGICLALLPVASIGAQEGTKPSDSPPAQPDSTGTGGPVSPPTAPERTDEKQAVQTVASDPDLERLLKDPEFQLTSIRALESEVTGLRGTLQGLVTEGGMGVELLDDVDALEIQLRELGVTDERAEQIQSLSNEVSALRARLRLMELRAPTETNLVVEPKEGLDPLKDLTVDETEVLLKKLLAERGGEAANEKKRRSLYPSREAILAFKQGDLEGVIEVLSGFGLHEIQLDALYVYGCALIETRRFADARKVFERVRSFEQRATLKICAERQLTRMDHLQNGVIGPDPLRREGLDK